MQGPPKRLRDPVLQGAIPRVCAQVFGEARNREEEGATVKITCSFLQIYQEQLYDMMSHSESSLKLRETPNQGVWVDNLTQAVVQSEVEMMRYVVAADKARSVAHTDMSERSSRSHSLVTMLVEQSFEDGMVITGKLVMVDLAGSEKVHKSRASGGQLVEARGINKSLSALGNCIQALTEPARGHVPYRDSKLTHLLKDSLGGNTKTSLLVACSPHWSNYEETISSLRFATRAKELKITAHVNQSASEHAFGAQEENLEDGLAALQNSTNTLFAKLSAFQPGDRLGVHHMNEIQHLSTWCNERMTHLIKQSQADQANESEAICELRARAKRAEQQVMEDAKRHAIMMQAQRESEQRSSTMAAQVDELEAECNRLRDHVERLTEESEKTVAVSREPVHTSQQLDSQNEVQRWKAKYEALKSRLPQMFDLVMENEEYEASPVPRHAPGHQSPVKVSPVKVSRRASPNKSPRRSPRSSPNKSPRKSPSNPEYGLVEMQLKYEESRHNRNVAKSMLARDATSPNAWHREHGPGGGASLSLSPSLSQSVSQSPMKPSPTKSPLRSTTNKAQLSSSATTLSPERALRNAIASTNFNKR